MDTLFSLLISMLLVISAASVGRSVRVLLRAGKSTCSERILVDTAVGFGVVSLVLFAASAFQLLHIIKIIFCVILAVGLVSIRGVVADIWAVIYKVITGKKSIVSLITGLILGAVAIVTLIPALAPPSMNDWDSLAYHLSVPKLYLEHGGFYYIPFMSHSNFPFLMEMLYLPGVVYGLPVAAKLINYWTAVLLAGTVVLIVRKHLNPKGGPLAALAIAGMPLVMWEATTAYVDISIALYTLIAVYLLMKYLDKDELPDLVLCGVCAGFAASTKMTGLLVFPLICVWLLADRWSADRRFQWNKALLLAGTAIAVCVPWYAKSFVYTGNPVYPFFYSVFGGKDWTAELAQNYTMLQAKFGMGHNPGAFLFLPYDLTFNSQAYYDKPGLYVGPIMLVALPVLFMAKYRSRKLAGLLFFFIAQVIVWFFLTQQSRYLIPAFAVLAALLAGIVYEYDEFRRTRAAMLAVFAGTAVFGMLTLYTMMSAALPVAIGAQSYENYLSKTLDAYPPGQYVNKHLPKGAKVALFGDTRGYYLDRPYIWADFGHNKMFSRDFESTGDFAEYLKSNGFDYALVNFAIFPGREDAGGNALLVYQAIENGIFRQIYPDDNIGCVAVYRIK